ncbi:MAG: hypothetical protein ACOX9E_04910, partial [Lentisphaeria bacterium]
KTQAHAGANRAVGLQPAAAHDPANEKPKHTQAPTVLWACSPQQHMTPQTACKHARNIAVANE